MFGRLLLPLKKAYRQDREYYEFLKNIFGFTPNNIELYKLALIHRSASLLLSDGTQMNNERLEFLGDAVIESIVSDFLFIEYPDRNEGYLTQLRSRLVNRSTLNKIALELGMDKYIIAHGGGNIAQQHLYGDALEAMVGAMYLDKGYDFTNRLFINDIIRRHINIATLSHTETDFKSRLIEWAQKNKRQLHFDTIVDPESTSHNPLFATTIVLDGKGIAHGDGRSKKDAEQNGAAHAVEALNGTIGHE